MAPAASVKLPSLRYWRIQRGLTSGATEWVYVGRGYGHDVPEESALRGKTGTSEVFIRGQMKAWLDYMTDAGS